MNFTRIPTASYPCVYETWSTDSASWLIQDLDPEDDEAAVEILVDNMLRDETLSSIQKMIEDPVSVQCARVLWGGILQQRLALGCYEVKGDQKNLVGVNICCASRVDDDRELPVEGEKLCNIYPVMKYCENKVDPFKYLGLDLLMLAHGLAVKREYRGAKLGKRLLAAREPLCKSQGIKGSATMFTSIAAQKLAESCGFHTIAEIPIRELAEKGMAFPEDDPRIIKYMVKRYE